MENSILIKVDEKGVVSYDLNVENSMTMMIGLVDAMNHNKVLANIVDGASEVRVSIRKSQELALETKLDKDQIDMFNEVKKQL